MVTRRNDYLTLLTYLDRCVRAPDHDFGMDAAELVDHAEHDRCASWNRNRLCPTLGVCSPTKLRCGSKSGSDQDKLVHALAGLSGVQLHRCHHRKNPEGAGQCYRGENQLSVQRSSNRSPIVHVGVLCPLQGSPPAILQAQQGVPDRMKKRRKQGGFTLIELAVVLGVSVMIASAFVGVGRRPTHECNFRRIYRTSPGNPQGIL